MINHWRGLGLALLGIGALAAPLAAQTAPPVPPAPIPNAPAAVPNQPAPAPDQAASNPVCVRLEGQLAILNRGATDPARAEQIKRSEDAIVKQQADLDRALAQSKKQGCEGGGFFALFTGRSPQCQPLNAQIQQMRDNLDHLMSDFERLKSGNADQEGPRRALIGQLAQNNCGPQYRAAAAAQGPGGFLDALFGGTIINPASDGAPSGTYRTVCVRTCDGYYFPISYSTVPNRFAEDARACQRECPATEAVLYTYHNPGEDIGEALSINGVPYTELPNAFHYRKEYVTSCSCRRPGQSWADALKGSDDSTTLESGDIVVTDQNAKALSQPPPPKGPNGKPLKPGNKDANAAPAAPAATASPQDANASAAPAVAADSDPAKRSVRTVGPPFVAGH